MAGDSTTIDYDEVETQIELIGRIADDIATAKSSLTSALDAQDSAAWTEEGAPAQLHWTLVNEAGHYRRYALDTLQGALRDAAENLQRTIEEFQEQDSERAQRYLAAINGVLADLPESSSPSSPATTPATTPASSGTTGDSPWV
ncbi:type VII secretion target [Microbacterium marinilacus]|nr:type VII secretion target [Microbacterium marinilacus]MBY0689503.1 hypothetical protein [Microbacterium marinilacus]